MTTREKIVDALFGTGGLLRVMSILSYVLVGTTCYLWINGDSVPESLLALTTAVVSFYMGGRFGSTIPS
jgi:hypothetical protein